MSFDERLTMRISEAQKSVLEELASLRSTSASAVARQILRTGLDQVINQGEDPAQISIIEEDE